MRTRHEINGAERDKRDYPGNFGSSQSAGAPLRACRTLAVAACLTVILAIRAQAYVGLLDPKDYEAEWAEKRASVGRLEERMDMSWVKDRNDRLHAILKSKNERLLPEALEIVNIAQMMVVAAGIPNPDVKNALEWVRTVQERKYGPNDPRLGDTLTRLGLIAATNREWPQARDLLSRGFKLQASKLDELSRTKRDNDPDQVMLMLGLNALVQVLMREQDFAGAEEWARRAKAIGTAQKDHSQEAGSEIQLAEIALLSGKPADALDHYKAARKIQQTWTFGGADDFSKIYSGMALANLEQGQRDEASRLAKIAWDFDRRNLDYWLTLSEGVALGGVGLLDPYSLAAALGDSDQLADTILRDKGCVMEAAFADRALGVESDILNVTSDLSRFRLARTTLAQMESGSPEEQQSNASMINERRAEVKQLEARLGARGMSLHRVGPSVDALGAALGPRRMLAEFLRYHHYLGRGRWEWAYGVMIFASGQKPRWLRLGRVADIDERVAAFQKILADPDAADSAGLQKTLGELYRVLWQPIAATLPGSTDEFIISPDGTLAFLPFATLLDPQGRFLAESARINYVTSGRDLLRPLPKPAAGPFVVFGNPAFRIHRAVPPKPAAAAAPGANADETELDPLELVDECGRIAQVFKTHDIPCQELLGNAATEANLAKIRSPLGLHFATHGEFSTRRPVVDLHSIVNNAPEQRSVIYLSGAQDTLDARAHGARQPLNIEQIEGPDAEIRTSMTRMVKGAQPVASLDGIVTAQEIGEYHLEGTRLVTLSACKTGLGEVRGGEGVLGLRRSFVEAGAQNLLVSLWKIPDGRTADVMEDFYTRAFPGGDIVGAWGETQRNWLHKLRYVKDEDHLFDAVYCAGAFVLSRQGRP